jgi:diguanylate cyclase
MPHFAPLHIPTLSIAVGVVLFTAASIMTLVGLTQRTYGGYWYWTTAQWANMLSALSILFVPEHPWMHPISVLLSMQWPLTMLMGMRQFYIRSNFRTPEWVDPFMLATCWCVYVMIWRMDPNDAGARIATFTTLNILCYLYTAWQVHSVRDWRQSPYLKVILIFLLIAAIVQVPRMFTAFASWGIPLAENNPLQRPAGLLGLVAAVMISVYMSLLLTYERTEQDLRESHRQLRVLADFDMLTQVPNRRHFNEMAAQTMRLSPPGSTSLVVFGIDHFKRVNDLSGHAAGDEALKLVAASARRILRSRDLVGRLGGDEFIALLPETSINDSLHVAERMVRHIDKERALQQLPALSLSFGIVQIQAGESLPEATHRADQALEEAKRLGRGRAVAADGQADAPVFTQGRLFGLG